MVPLFNEYIDKWGTRACPDAVCLWDALEGIADYTVNPTSNHWLGFSYQ